MCKICEGNEQGLKELGIYNCNKIINIPTIQKLHTLIIHTCENIINIPNIQGLHTLVIISCFKIVDIPYIQELKRLNILNCLYLEDINSDDKEEIENYLSKLQKRRETKAKKIINKCIWRWYVEKIVEKRYHPDNILKYINLEE